LSYFAVIFALAAVAPHSAAKARCLARIVLDGGVVVCAALFARTLIHISLPLRAHVYRAALAGVVLDSYLMLRDLLPTIRADAVDATLRALDLALFGVEPTLWFERFNQQPVVEWFSFFYLSYFALCGGYIAAMLWLVRNGRCTSVFAIGSLIVLLVGQLGYMAVPGFGPIHHLSTSFHAPLHGGFWWNCVWRTVQAGSAMKDIFPSLHTAVPTWFTLFAIQQARRDKRWRIVALLTGFAASQIVVSTMVLRWHYAIDVAAGLTLAMFAATVAPKIAHAEALYRRRHRMRAVWRFADRSDRPEPAVSDGVRR
jgi:hypothetical protein